MSLSLQSSLIKKSHAGQLKSNFGHFCNHREFDLKLCDEYRVK